MSLVESYNKDVIQDDSLQNETEENLQNEQEEAPLPTPPTKPVHVFARKFSFSDADILKSQTTVKPPAKSTRLLLSGLIPLATPSIVPNPDPVTIISVQELQKRLMQKRLVDNDFVTRQYELRRKQREMARQKRKTKWMVLGSVCGLFLFGAFVMFKTAAVRKSTSKPNQNN